MEQNTGWKTAGLWSAWLSLIPFGMGLHKMFAYKSSDSFRDESVNAYVGGDAYNYIINANYATAYFVLTGILLLAAIGCGVIYYLSYIAACQNEPSTGKQGLLEPKAPDNPED